MSWGGFEGREPSDEDLERTRLHRECDEINRKTEPKIESILDDLNALRTCQMEHLKRVSPGSRQGLRIREGCVARKARDIERQSERFPDWVRDAMYLDEQPWIRGRRFCVLKDGE